MIRLTEAQVEKCAWVIDYQRDGYTITRRSMTWRDYIRAVLYIAHWEPRSSNDRP